MTLAQPSVRATGRPPFRRTYDQQWLIERHGYRSPIETRDHPRTKAAR
jgi:hypothetical protein